MGIKGTYSLLILRVSFLTLSGVLLGYVLFELEKYPLAGLVFVIIVIQVLALIYTLNKTNRKITFFFDAIRNDDATLSFPEDVIGQTEQDLNRSLNKVNKMIQQARSDQISQEKYYSYILEMASTGLLAISKEGKVLLANQAVKYLTGTQKLNHIKQLSSNEKLFNAIKSICDGKAKDRIVKFTNEKEQVQLSLKSETIVIRDNELSLIAINNIQNELEEQEIESWIRLIRVLTHEIMNSMAPITSLAQTLAEIYQDNNQIDTNALDPAIRANTINGLNIIQQRGEGLISFVDSYRKLTKVPKPIKEWLEVKKLFENVRILVSQEPNFYKVRMVIQVAGEMRIHADRPQIMQVFLNLVKNALEAFEEKPEGTIAVSATPAENKIRITIADDGDGIPEVIAEQVFIPFFTTKEGGSGIGLSLSNHILRLHGSSLKLTSNSNGTTFHFEL